MLGWEASRASLGKVILLVRVVVVVVVVVGFLDGLQRFCHLLLGMSIRVDRQAG